MAFVCWNWGPDHLSAGTARTMELMSLKVQKLQCLDDVEGTAKKPLPSLPIFFCLGVDPLERQIHSATS